MPYDNKPNLNCNQFEQTTGDYLYLAGHNCICLNGTIGSNTGYMVSGVTIFDTGIATSSIKIGQNAITNGIAAISVGAAACATGTTSIAIGCNSKSCGNSSISLGTLSQTSGLNSIAIGCSCALKNCSIAIGEACALGNNSVAIGNTVLAYGDCSVIIGSFINNATSCSFGLGWNDGTDGYQSPSILFSNNKSYFNGSGNPLVGFGLTNPQARVDINSNIGNGFRLIDGCQGLNKVLMSNECGFGSWSDIAIITGNTNYIPMFDSGGCNLTESILKMVSPNILESQYSGNTIIRPLNASPNYNGIEIHGGCKNGYDETSPIILRSSCVKICQPETLNPAKFGSDSSNGFMINSINSNLTLLNDNSIVFNTNKNLSPSITLRCVNYCYEELAVTRCNSLNICGYSGITYNMNGCNVGIFGGNANQQSCSVIGNGGNVILMGGLGKGSGTHGNIYLCSLPNKTTEDCIIFINSSGGLSYGVENASGSIISGNKNTIPKFNSTCDNIINSSICDCDTTNSIYLGKQYIVLGDCQTSTSVVLKAHDYADSTVNLIISAGRCLEYTSGNEDGFVYIDPGKGTPEHNLYIGSPTFNKSTVGIIPEGSPEHIKMFLCGKGSGHAGVVSNGGIVLGIPNNLMCINGDCVSKYVKSDICVTGFDTEDNSDNAMSVYVRGGNAIGSSTSGGDVLIFGGVGTYCNGKIKLLNLENRTNEICGLFINCSGVITSGIIANTVGSVNGLSKTGSSIKLGGTLTGNTTITGAYSLNLCNGAKLNTQYGYQISGVTMFRTSTSTISSIYIGQDAGSNGIGRCNIGIGYNTLYCNIGGWGNIAIGDSTMICNSSGNNNIGLGLCSLYYNVSGCHNIGLGISTLFCNNAGEFNIAIGATTLTSNLNGTNNVGIGNSVLHNNYSGDYNIGIGGNVLAQNNSGVNNIGIGVDSLSRNYSGVENIGIGTNSLYFNINGNSNIGIGAFAGHCSIGNSNIYVGRYAGTGNTSSNRLYIGNCGICTLIYGEFDNKLVKIDGNLCSTLNMCAQNFIQTSDCRLKTNIAPIEIKPVNIEYKQYSLVNDMNQIRYGVIAQDLEKEYPELVRVDENGMMSVSYFDLLIKEISYLKCKVYELENKINK